MSATLLRIFMWLLGALVVVLAFVVWWPQDKTVTAYVLFPLLGIIAFSLMWTHYIGGALRRYFGHDETVLRRYLMLTSYVVLFCIIAHPALLDIQLYRDGLGLPIDSLPAVYTGTLERIAIYTGIASLLCFLLYELHRFFAGRSWWKYVEWANIVAMVAIAWHGFTLGGELRTPWFQIVWAFYVVSFVAAVSYSQYHKRRYEHATSTNP